MWTRLLTSLFLAAFVTGVPGGSDKPRLQLGGTTLTGKRLQPSNLEFFGGQIVLSLIMLQSALPHPLTFRYPFRRASCRWPPLLSSEAQVFPFPITII